MTGSDRVRAFWACVLRKDWGRCSKFEGEERDWIGDSPAREGGEGSIGPSIERFHEKKRLVKGTSDF